MYWLIKWTKDGFTRWTLTDSGGDIALKYALMREKQGYDVDILPTTQSEFNLMHTEANYI